MMLLMLETSLRSMRASTANWSVSAANETPGAVPDCFAASVVAASSPIRWQVRLPVSYAPACDDTAMRHAPKRADLYMADTPEWIAPRGSYQSCSKFRSRIPLD